MAKDTSPFAAMEAAFRRLGEYAESLTVDRMWLDAGTADGPLLVTEMRDVLLDPGTGYEVRDRVLREVAARAVRDDRWMVALAGLVLPGLRRAVRELVGRCPDLREDAEAEALAGLVVLTKDVVDIGRRA